MGTAPGAMKCGGSDFGATWSSGTVGALNPYKVPFVKRKIIQSTAFVGINKGVASAGRGRGSLAVCAFGDRAAVSCSSPNGRRLHPTRIGTHVRPRSRRLVAADPGMSRPEPGPMLFGSRACGPFNTPGSSLRGCPVFGSSGAGQTSRNVSSPVARGGGERVSVAPRCHSSSESRRLDRCELMGPVARPEPESRLPRLAPATGCSFTLSHRFLLLRGSSVFGSGRDRRPIPADWLPRDTTSNALLGLTGASDNTLSLGPPSLTEIGSALSLGVGRVWVPVRPRLADPPVRGVLSNRTRARGRRTPFSVQQVVHDPPQLVRARRSTAPCPVPMLRLELGQYFFYALVLLGN